MATLLEYLPGGYLFLSGNEAFSGGVVALPGFEIVRVTLHSPIPYQPGFTMIENHLKAQGRPIAALCGVELRSPRPFSFAEFADFNLVYQSLLSERGLMVQEQCPIARTNVAPAFRPPAEPVLYAFSYTVPVMETAGHGSTTFVVSGAGEVRQRTIAPETIVRFGETSAEAVREKAAQVMHIMCTRLSRLNVTWAEVMEASIYTVHPMQSFLVTEILDVIGQASVHGVHWYYSHPPVKGLEFEMDIRGVRREFRLD